ncbi:hypothetical protein B0H14DRAFT_3483575 [Mycena olivaceomarginata]|nr:hypothetical protein B0H14DRAFT_3483575 [Mycena olivaceomarginata]
MENTALQELCRSTRLLRWTSSFHHNLTDAECEPVRLRGGKSCKFVSDSYEWAVANQISGYMHVHAPPPPPCITPEFMIAFSLKHGAVLNILDLTSLIASKGDDVIVNEVLCARIALMRAVYEEHPHDDFWDFLDVRIETISKAAGGDSAKIVRAFHFALTTDQKKYDTEDVYEIDKSGGSAFQDDIDGIIVGQTMAAAAAAASSAANAAGSSMANPDPFLVNANPPLRRTDHVVLTPPVIFGWEPVIISQTRRVGLGLADSGSPVTAAFPGPARVPPATAAARPPAQCGLVLLDVKQKSQWPAEAVPPIQRNSNNLQKRHGILDGLQIQRNTDHIAVPEYVF